ncbi:MAG TPA: response regulator, partial [Steroidobacteraceae bacterium]|nr:response regulator [Steroidobacteraceae bacterium]
MPDLKAAPLARVLVVDDEPGLLAALCEILTTEGYAALGVRSGPEALDALRAAMPEAARRFDVLITDLKMPGMDGIDLLHAARQIDADLVSVIMTGHGTIDTAVQALRGG